MDNTTKILKLLDILISVDYTDKVTAENEQEELKRYKEIYQDTLIMLDTIYDYIKK